jgi:hypothetical protein
MTFLVKENVLDADGNSYVSLADADSYFADRVNAKWSVASDLEKKAALISATDYIVGRWGASFTDAVTESETIPLQLEKATSEYAVRALAGPLIPDPVVDNNGFAQVLTRKKTGPLEKEFQVVGNVRYPTVYRSYPSADLMMVPMLKLSQTNRVYR